MADYLGWSTWLMTEYLDLPWIYSEYACELTFRYMNLIHKNTIFLWKNQVLAIHFTFYQLAQSIVYIDNLGPTIHAISKISSFNLTFCKFCAQQKRYSTKTKTKTTNTRIIPFVHLLVQYSCTVYHDSSHRPQHILHCSFCRNIVERSNHLYNCNWWT